MATARFIAGPVARKIATASGSVTPAVATGTPSVRDPSTIAGSEASELCVLIATACAGSAARAKSISRSRAPSNASG